MDWHYAYNYWRKAFVEASDGEFTKEDFDEWFQNGADIDMGYFPTSGELSSQEQFFVEMRQAFINMLQACANGAFSR